ncbi:carbonic anhydrase [Mycena leptocephala]|nr:carbonic anhydrase [Mycena leptocephala]
MPPKRLDVFQAFLTFCFLWRWSPIVFGLVPTYSHIVTIFEHLCLIMITGKFFALSLSLSLVSASPLKSSQAESASSNGTSTTISNSISVAATASSATPSASGAPVGTVDDAALSALLDGNKEFKSSSKLSIAQNLTQNGPEPPFMIFECADNRVTAGTIFHATLGTIFSQHNLGNLYSQTDPNANASLVYGVEELGVKHIIVLGHYGCPTVGAALMGNATTPSRNKSRAEPSNSTHIHTSKEAEAWIQPIRELYMSSNRSEIVALRNNKTTFMTIPEASNSGFRALVEENVKASVARIQKDSILAKAYQPTEIDVFVHGFVYDMDTGDVLNLGVTFGPPGKTLPKVPFSVVASATKALASAHSATQTASASASNGSAVASSPASTGSSSESASASAS